VCIMTHQIDVILRSLKRDRANRFNDHELAKILLDATETPAAAFKARGIPECFRVIEILGIEQSRAWSACSVCYVSASRGL
jgi:prostaglandin-endoperoxide synthase 2